MSLIVTCARHLEEEAQSELTKILNQLGDNDPKISITKMSGILTADTSVNPLEVTKKIKDIIDEEPWLIRYILRVIPIQCFVNTEYEDIIKKAVEYAEKIKGGETYRISIKKRNSTISSRQLIDSIASKIGNKVSLENPDWIIQIEVLGGKTGVSVLKAQDITSVEKTKRNLLE